MKKAEINVGGLYSARVSGRYVTVRVDQIRQGGGFGASNRETTLYDVTNLSTGRKTTFRSAAKFRGELKTDEQKLTKLREIHQPQYFGEEPDPLRPTEASVEEDRVAPPTAEDMEDAGCTPPTDGFLEQCERKHARINAIQEASAEADPTVSVPQPDSAQPAVLPGATATTEDKQCNPFPQPTDSDGATAAESTELSDASVTVNGGANDAGKEDEQCSDPTSVTTPTVDATGGMASISGLAAAVSAADLSTATADAVSTSASVGYVSSFAARIAACAVPRTTGLTDEQEAILATAKEIEGARGNGQRVMVIGAGAGTGKTFTLKQLEQVLAGNGQYTAFNSSLVAESKVKFQRAACNTTHSLAFRAVGRRFAHRLNGPRVKSYQIAAQLGIEDQYIELPESIAPPEVMPDGTKKLQVRRLKAPFLAGQVTEAIRKFCQSADPEIGVKHFARFDGIDEKGVYTNSDRVKSYLLPIAQKAWADLSSETGTLPFAHDVYVKLWQLGTGPDRPVIAADYILLDEAQDTAPVMLGILQQQTHALLVLVGDDNQQIYEWRGAVNAMATFPGAPRKLLSQSFRFGQSVADVANSVLAGLDEPTDLIMSGLPTIPTRVCPVAQPRCYLYRTNAGAIGKLMSEMDNGKRGHLIGGTKEVVAFCRAALDLQAGKGTAHQELGCFVKWSEVQEYSKEAEGADLRLMVKLIDDFKADRIIKALDDMPSEKDADLILSTAHRSKGREWASVRLGQDFPTANKLSDADRRLVYVACTRAQEELDISECPTFCGGWDKNGEGGPDNGGGSEWIPGIDIEYTAPMPSTEDLAAYRAAKSAPKSPTTGERPAPAIAPAGTPIPAPSPILAPANGGNGATGEFTWANMDGKWCVRGPRDQTGKRVTVTRKNGTKSQETLRSVARKLGEIWFYSVI